MKSFLRVAGILAAFMLVAAPFCAAPAVASGPGTGLSTYQCAANQNISGNYPSGGPYTAAVDGIVTGVNTNDDHAMDNAGCQLIGVAGPTMIARLIGANMNVTTDQAIPMLIAPSAYYVPTAVIVKNCSTSLTTAKGQIYDTASKGGTALFGSATTQVYSACTGVGTDENLAATSAGAAVVDSATANPPILSLTTAQGAAATADVYVYGYVIGNK